MRRGLRGRLKMMLYGYEAVGQSSGRCRGGRAQHLLGHCGATPRGPDAVTTSLDLPRSPPASTASTSSPTHSISLRPRHDSSIMHSWWLVAIALNGQADELDEYEYI